MDTNEILKRIERIRHELAALENALQAGGSGVDATAEALEKFKRRECLLCGERIEKSEKNIRGLHERCYRKMSREIEEGFGTWEDAVAKGFALPEGVRKRGRKSSPSPFREAVEQSFHEREKDVSRKAEEDIAKYTRKGTPAPKTSRKKKGQ